MHHHLLRTMASDGGVLTQAYGGQLWLTEHGAGHQVVVDLAVKTSEHRIGIGPALIDRHRSETNPVGHITDRMNVGNVGGLIGIHGDLSSLHLDARRSQIQPIEEGSPAGGEQHTATAQPIALTGQHRKVSRKALNGLWGGGEAQVDTLLHHAFLNGIGEFTIKAAQKMIPARTS